MGRKAQSLSLPDPAYVAECFDLRDGVIIRRQCRIGVLVHEPATFVGPRGVPMVRIYHDGHIRRLSAARVAYAITHSQWPVGLLAKPQPYASDSIARALRLVAMVRTRLISSGLNTGGSFCGSFMCQISAARSWRRSLRALRSDLVDPIISVHHGRIVKRTGDGSIIEFRSVVDAVRCAIEVQNGMVIRNAGVPAGDRIDFRVGVHLGDVVEEADGDLMGDGVNIAARLEGLSEPGGLCLSSAAYEQIRDRLKETFADLGEKQLKNIARPVRVFGLSRSAIAAARSGIARTAPAPKARGLSSRWPAFAAALALAVLAAAGGLCLACGLRAAFHGRFS